MSFSMSYLYPAYVMQLLIHELDHMEMVKDMYSIGTMLIYG